MELNHDHLTRQLDIIPVASLGTPIKIIGCGAIGSFTSLQLAKMGFTNQEVWDFDDVSIENMSNQFFRRKDIGHNKAEALRDLVAAFTGEEIEAHPVPYTKDALLTGIVISAVDSMSVRKEIFEAIKATGFTTSLLIDPRMSAETISMYCLNPFNDDEVESYKKVLHSDGEAVQERCTAKSTMYTVNLVSGLIAKTVKNFVCKENYPANVQWDTKSSETSPRGMALVMYPNV